MVDDLGSFLTVNINKLEWHDNSAPAKASSNTGFVTPKSIPHDFFIHACDETMVPSSQGSSCDVMYFASACHEGLSHDEIFGIGDLDPPSAYDPNIPAHVNTDKGILSNHAKVQDILDENLGNENESDDVNHASINEDNHHGNTARVDEHLDDDNAPLNNATSIGEDNHNKSDTQDSKYDADSSKNEKAKDDVDVMIDKENEIHEVEVRSPLVWS
nr:hypothetical protein [Tanacetum cinerariifolium]